jgi:hypothetical protein
MKGARVCAVPENIAKSSELKNSLAGLSEDPERLRQLLVLGQQMMWDRLPAALDTAKELFDCLRPLDFRECVNYLRATPPSPETVAAMIYVAHRELRKEQARAGATAKIARDPKQAAKSAAFKLWQDWQTGKTLHKSSAAFHRHVLDKLPVITSTKTVERWCKEWREENRDSAS